MQKFNCKKFVFSSSATVYSFNESSPLFESSMIEPFNPYGKTKVAVENFLQDLKNKPGDSWNLISLRYFNPIGAHPSGNFGESPSNKPIIFSLVFVMLAAGKEKNYLYMEKIGRLLMGLV